MGFLTFIKAVIFSLIIGFGITLLMLGFDKAFETVCKKVHNYNVERYFKKNQKEESDWNTKLLIASNPKTSKEILVALMDS